MPTSEIRDLQEVNWAAACLYEQKELKFLLRLALGLTGA